MTSSKQFLKDDEKYKNVFGKRQDVVSGIYVAYYFLSLKMGEDAVVLWDNKAHALKPVWS